MCIKARLKIRRAWHFARRHCVAILLAALPLPGASPAWAADVSVHHHHIDAGGAYPVPPLSIRLPEDGAVVGTQLALVFETPGDMRKLTMSAPVVGVHLHVAVDDTVLMPTAEQLIRLGAQRYLFLFDLPVRPGVHRLSVYWADPAHGTIEKSVRRVTVRAVADLAP
jgi:hypothetical protein